MSDLWILAGQSNMEGLGKLKDVEPPSDKVRVFAHGDEWQRAQEPLHWLLESKDAVHAEIFGIKQGDVLRAAQETRQTRQTGAGLALSFAKAVAERASVDIDLLPCAHGGTSMEQWSPQMKELGGHSLFGALLRRVRVALETGGDIRLAGILWYQGESDAWAESARVYTERMKVLIQELRDDLGSPNLPFYLVQLGAFATPDSPDWNGNTTWSQIREAQRRLTAEVRQVEMAPAIDLELDDPIHIGTQGLKRLGRRLANTALAKVYGKNAPAGIALKSAMRKREMIRVQFEGVHQGLSVPDPVGRISGFSLKAQGAPADASFIYRAEVDPDDVSAVLLHIAQETPRDIKLCYGWGLSPFCQLTDQADMAVPAFGPVPME